MSDWSDKEKLKHILSKTYYPKYDPKKDVVYYDEENMSIGVYDVIHYGSSSSEGNQNLLMQIAKDRMPEQMKKPQWRKRNASYPWGGWKLDGEQS